MRTQEQMAARLGLMVDRMCEAAARNLSKTPNQGAGLLRFAAGLAQRGHAVAAFRAARKALDLSRRDPELGVRVRAFLASLAPGYHLAMINDRTRIEAWDRALRSTVKPGMHVLEIGSGPGLLSLMAARAGAARVTTCEFDPVIADLARTIVKLNGYADRIDVIASASYDLRVGRHMQQPADLVFCDNFSDNMFSFEPLRSLGDARNRLLKPDAPALPRAASVRLALADWGADARFFRPGDSLGFDMSPAVALVPDSVDMEIGEGDLTLMSDACDVFEFDFNGTSYPVQGRAEVVLEAERDGVVNGIAQWIRLALTDDVVLEARPRAGAISFSNPRFYPLAEPRSVRRGDRVPVTAQHDVRTLVVWAT